MRMFVLKYGLIFCSLILSTQILAADSLSVEEGEKLFSQTCKACHHLEMRLVGPALKGVEDRHEEEWLIRFITSSQSMVKEGDSAAVALFNTYNQVIMPDHAYTEIQIRSILEYVKNATKPAVATGSITRPVATQAVSTVKPPRFSDYRFWILYTVTVVLVIVSIYYKAEMIALRKKIEPAETD